MTDLESVRLELKFINNQEKQEIKALRAKYQSQRKALATRHQDLVRKFRRQNWQRFLIEKIPPLIEKIKTEEFPLRSSISDYLDPKKVELPVHGTRSIYIDIHAALSMGRVDITLVLKEEGQKQCKRICLRTIAANRQDVGEAKTIAALQEIHRNAKRGNLPSLVYKHY